MKKLLFFIFCISTAAFAQHNNPNKGYWQQHASYKMNVDMDVKSFKYKGTQELVYTNNSPDT